MTTQPKKEKGVGGTVAVVGIPLAVLITWIFTAGQFSSGIEARVTANEKCIQAIKTEQVSLTSKLNDQSTQLVRIETHYEHIKELLAEIRQDIKRIESEREAQSPLRIYDGIAIGSDSI